MTIVNWREFEAKFCAGTQLEFERMAYLLFCHIYDAQYGIFRYRNHPGCETASVQVGNDLIGFQAKYYRGDLSSHVDDLKKSIDTVRAHDSRTTKVIFFLPDDFTYNTRGKDDSLKTEAQSKVETYASLKGIKIDWFCASRIEKTFAEEELEHWAKHFFSREPNMLRALQELEFGTKDILDTIKDAIIVGEERIEFDRSNEANKILSALEDGIVIVTGSGGVGKTAVIKKLAEEKRFDLLLMLRPHEIADKLSRSGFNRLWRTTPEEFFDLCADCPKRVLIIDAAEKIPTLPDKEVLFSTLKHFRDAGWKVLLTTRSIYVSRLQASISLKMAEAYEMVDIKPIAVERVSDILTGRYGGVTLNDTIKDFLTIPFYLNIYLNSRHRFTSSRQIDFINEVWAEVVQGGDPMDSAGSTLLKMVEKKVTTDSHFIDPNGYSSDDIVKLLHREILVRSDKDGVIQLAHDIFEEMGMCRIIENKYSALQPTGFEAEVLRSYAYRRSFRQWIAYKTLDNDEASDQLVASVVEAKSKIYRSEYILAMADDLVCDVFLKKYKDILLRDEKNVFTEFVNTVYSLKRTFLPGKYGKALPASQPDGKAWQCVICFITENLDRGVLKCNTILPLMRDWCLAHPDSVEANACARAALFIYRGREALNKKGNIYVRSDDLADLLIAAGIGYIELIKNDLEIDINNESGYISAVAIAITRKLLINWQEKLVVSFIDRNPLYVLDLMKRRWLYRHHPQRGYYFDDPFEKSEIVFGIDVNTHSEYNEPSAFQTPIYRLLNINVIDTLNFILDFVNYTTEKAVSKYPSHFCQTTFTFPNGKKVKQYISDELWLAHRAGYSGSVPKLYACMHMALEKFLLEQAKDSETLHSASFKLMLKALIIRSKSASISSVVTSVVLAHYKELSDVALILFTSREAFACDYRRLVSEEQLKSSHGLFSWHKTIYSLERENSDKEDFRSISLESLAENYQLCVIPGEDKLDEKVRAIIDAMFPDKENINDDDKFFLRRIDTRFQKFTCTKDPKTGNTAILIEPSLTPELLAKQLECKKSVEGVLKFSPLGRWGHGVISGEIATKPFFDEDAEAQKMAELLCEVAQGANKSDPYYYLIRKNLIDCATALLVKYDTLIPKKCRTVCIGIVDEAWGRLVSPEYNFQVGDGVIECIFAQPYVMKYDWPWVRARKTRQFLRLFLNKRSVDIYGYSRICDAAFRALRYYGETHTSYVYRMIKSYKKICNENDPAFYLDVINLLPTNKYDDGLFIEIIKKGILIALKYVFGTDDSGKNNVRRHQAVGREYCKCLATWLLKMPETSADEILGLMINVKELFFNGDFLGDLIYAADIDPSVTDRFWHIWELLLPVVVSIAHNKDLRLSDSDMSALICAYLLAIPYWKPDAKQWKHLSADNKDFIDKVVSELKDVSMTAEALIRLLNTVGHDFRREGFVWLSRVFSHAKFDGNYDMDRTARIKIEIAPLLIEVVDDGWFAEENETWKKSFLSLLDFLVLNHSIEAFYVREQILF